MSLMTIDEFLVHPKLASIVRQIAARWGEEAPRKLLEAERASDYYDAQDRKSGTLKPLSLGFTAAGPLAWATVNRMHTGKAWVHYLHKGTRFVGLEGLPAFRAVLLDGRPAVERDADHLLVAYERLAHARVIRSPEAGEPTHLGKFKKPSNPLTFRRAKAPHFVGREFVFCATLPWRAKLLQLTVDLDTLAVSEKVLGGCTSEPLPRGREYASPEGPVLASLVEAQVTAHPIKAPAVLRQALARAWREAALSEHASVASFARVSLELMALGAPLDLVRRTHEAALDEIRHADLAFALAAGLDGCSLVAGPLPALAPREPSFARVFLDTLHEAAIPETLAAAEMHAAADAALDPALATQLRTIAEDESRHAALAWDSLDWCLRGISPDELRAALEPVLMPPSLSTHAIPPGYGFLSSAERAALFQRVFAEQISPRLDRLRRGAK